MQPLTFKMLFRKKGTVSAILAIALLIAMITAVDCLVNNINAQTTALTKLASLGEKYLVTSKTSNALSDSRIDANILDQIKNNSDINYATSQQIIQATLFSNAGDFAVTVRAVDNIQAFLNNRNAYVDGTVSQNQSQANIGIILSKLAQLKTNDMLNITINEKPIQFSVAGITQAQEESDSEIIIPLTTLQDFTKTNSTVSFIEFSLSDPDQASTVLNNLTSILPANTKITNMQQLVPFAQDVNNQTVIFINIWSIAVLAVVAGASYIIAARSVNEAEYELYMLKTLGAKKNLTVTMVFTYTMVIAVVGLILGIAGGIVGTQVASTFVRWLWGNTQLAPFLYIDQAVGIFILAFASAMLGGVYPAIKAAQNTSTEVQL